MYKISAFFHQYLTSNLRLAEVSSVLLFYWDSFTNLGCYTKHRNNTVQKNACNTTPYFTVLGQITSIYRHAKTIIEEYTGSYSDVFRVV